ncbi:response regulator transcription factor [Streptomyces sp. NPDC048331]|uniref:response regulator transcription factor n=1 Tax=Streptomyces sp. NPDC048331 TaxID=3365534 RepID=UPI003719856A
MSHTTPRTSAVRRATAGARAPGAPHWTPALERVGRLTPREQETFLLLAEGLSNETMARRLHVTERTVRAHVAAVMEKLELSSRLTVCLASYVFSTENTDATDRPVS